MVISSRMTSTWNEAHRVGMMDTIADSTRRPWAPLVGPMSSGGAIWLAVAHYFNRPKCQCQVFWCDRIGAAWSRMLARFLRTAVPG
jgi:hypothetical protein